MQNLKKGFSSLILILTIVIILVIAGAYYGFKNKEAGSGNPPIDTVSNNSAPDDSSKGDEAKWSTFEIAKYGLKFQYPSNYQIRDYSSMDFQSLPHSQTSLISIDDPTGIVTKDETSRQYTKTLQVTIYKQDSFSPLWPETGPISLKSFIETHIASGKVLSTEEIRLGAETGLRMIDQKSDGSKSETLYALHNGLFYSMEYIPNNHPMFAKILTTFEFTDQ